MPMKYSHVKKRSASATPRKSTKSSSNLPYPGQSHRNPTPHIDRSISQAMTAVSELERAISRILILRYEQDICRLYSTRLHNVALVYLPKLMLDCIDISSPGWVAANAECDEIKDFFRGAISMDMRQAGERVATKSVLWSYTALRHFAMSNNVPICQKRGLHSLRLLPHYDALKAHLDTLNAMPVATFAKPTHLPSLDESVELLEEDLSRKRNKSGPAWDNWKMKVRIGYERLVDTLWSVAREFDVRGYGLILREKLTTKWCDCGCSTDHLGEVCERTVREEEEESGVRPGKEREWDGRGSGIFGWQTDEEEDIWEMDLDFGGLEPEECEDPEMTIGELMEWRYFKAERSKELGNKAFRQGDYEVAIKRYTDAHDTEPELPHYQLNIAAAHLKLQNWMQAEKACNLALSQHKSGKGYWRRAKARRMMGRIADATKDIRAVLKIQPTNTEAIAELLELVPSEATTLKPRTLSRGASKVPESVSLSSSTASASSSSATSSASGSSASASRGPGSPNGSTSSGRKGKGKTKSNGNGNGHADGISQGTSSSSSPTYTHELDTSIFRPTTKPYSKPLPFDLVDLDFRKLRISTIPLQVEMPVLGPSANGKGKGPSFDMRIETYSYPTWERCKVQRAD
ncbi:hypothetical protein BD410DRAFT_896049 [Rickenella mellea]|uniref:TPR-like protein n=1 Tax=Rickenella mellea TaxID=50990 RepID=A0A4Y7QDS9_9AGAM|nr:hypothetical protein BD410DRAFT_896049 [Rickenella mellea]